VESMNTRVHARIGQLDSRRVIEHMNSSSPTSLLPRTPSKANTRACTIALIVERRSQHRGSRRYWHTRSPGYGLLLVAESTTEAIVSCEVVRALSLSLSLSLSRWLANSTDRGSVQNALGGMTPEDVAAQACDQLLREIAVGGYVDSTNQGMMLLFMVLCTENVSKIRLGRLTNHTIQLLRHIRDCFGVRFKITSSDEGESLLLTCMGIGFKNLAKRVW